MKQYRRILKWFAGSFSLLAILFFSFVVYLFFSPFSKFENVRVYAQTVFELSCPLGTQSIQSMQTFDTVTGKSRQNFCVDALGNLTSQGIATSLAPAQTIYASPNCPLTGAPRCIQLPLSGGIFWDCSWPTSAAPVTVTCPDAAFTATNTLGVTGFGSNTFGAGGNPLSGVTNAASLNQGAVTFISATQVSVNASGVACTTAGNTACVFIFANFADTAAALAWTTAINTFDCATLKWDSGVWLFAQPEFNTTTAACKLGVGIARTGPGLSGQGMNATIFVPAPLLNFPGCTFGVSGTACFFTSGGIQLSNFQMFGGDVSLTGQTHANRLIEINSATTANTTSSLRNVSFAGFGGGATSLIGVSINGNTPEPWSDMWVQAFGAQNLVIEGSNTGGGIAGLFVEDCNVNCIYINGAGNGLILSGNSAIGPTFNPGAVGTAGTIRIEGGGYFTDYGSSIDYANANQSATTPAFYTNSVASSQTIRLFGTQVRQITNNAGIFSLSGTNAKVYVSASILTSPGTGAIVFCNSSATNQFFDLGGITGTFPTTPVLSCPVGSIVGSASITGTNLTTGNIGLTSGWGTSSVATATGDSHRGRFTITGAAGAATPTLTLTFPTPYFASATPANAAAPSCQLIETGANDIASLTNPVSAAATNASVVFTLTGTPVAVTYQFDYACGP